MKSSVQQFAEIPNYEVIQMIGQGQFGKVYKAQCSITKQLYAVKLIPHHKIKKHRKLSNLLQNESEILGEILQHENIVSYRQTIKTQKYIAMIYQFCDGGTLEDRIPLPQRQCVGIMLQIVKGLKHASQANVLHRDIKPANILFKSINKMSRRKSYKQIVKIGDWGFSRILQPNQTTESFLGSPAYMAPQILLGQQYKNSADVWSLGIMMYECLYGKCPWQCYKIKDLADLIKNKPIYFPQTNQLKTSVSSKCKQIIKSILTFDAKNRISLVKLQEHLIRLKNSEISTIKKQIRPIFDQNLKTNFLLEIANFLKPFFSQELGYETMAIILRQAKELLALKKQLNPQELPYNLFEKSASYRTVPSPNKLHKLKSQISAPNSQRESSKNLTLQERIVIIRKAKKQFEQKLKKIDRKKSYTEHVQTVVNYAMQELQQHLIIVEKTAEKSKSPMKTKKILLKTQVKPLLVNLNLVLDIIVFRELPEEYEKFEAKEYIQNLVRTSKSLLAKLLNHKIMYINQKYGKQQDKVY